VDTVFVAVPLDRGLRPGLVDRALALAWDGGADPVVVLTKADLSDDPAGEAARAATVCPAAPVVAVSATAGLGIGSLAPWLAPGRTVALLGPSGAGKSTLVNRLLAREAMATGEVRDSDARGRHTTVHRHLHVVPGCAVLVDTPGLREIALFGAEEGLGAAFADLEALAAGCRFRDCSHGKEPGCAVLAAVAEGTLDGVRLESWRKLRREEAHLERKLGLEAPWAAKRQRRARGRSVRAALDRKRGLREGEIPPG
jgi:ribosome biogenesis GTPase